ncbi:hypothetical protein MMC21_005979 [Puttea exsequens]|nr:hypothetical protein [Puttea exsequens]
MSEVMVNQLWRKRSADHTVLALNALPPMSSRMSRTHVAIDVDWNGCHFWLDTDGAWLEMPENICQSVKVNYDRYILISQPGLSVMKGWTCHWILKIKFGVVHHGSLLAILIDHWTCLSSHDLGRVTISLSGEVKANRRHYRFGNGIFRTFCDVETGPAIDSHSLDLDNSSTDDEPMEPQETKTVGGGARE